MNSKIKCPQKKCSFNAICVGMGKNVGCQKCEECGCEPNMIDTNCDRCNSCSRDEGDLRWGSPTNDNKEVEVEIKPMEIIQNGDR
jgi:hypothetical protein